MSQPIYLCWLCSKKLKDITKPCPRCDHESIKHQVLVMAHYMCIQCKRDFTAPPGPPVNCPSCGHNYAKWLDYPAFEKLVADFRTGETDREKNK
jgi:DNA-directed RNA polymerase subunit RPC12/RpoP